MRETNGKINIMNIEEKLVKEHRWAGMGKKSRDGFRIGVSKFSSD